MKGVIRRLLLRANRIKLRSITEGSVAFISFYTRQTSPPERWEGLNHICPKIPPFPFFTENSARRRETFRRKKKRTRSINNLITIVGSSNHRGNFFHELLPFIKNQCIEMGEEK